MVGKRIGYIRVSTADQNPDRQLDGIQLDKRFIEYASAKSANRPQLQLMLEFIREDDVVILHSMDRLARNLKDLKQIVDTMVSKKVQVQFLKEQLTFTGDESASSTLILHLMGAFAEFEHSFIRERQAEGIAVAKRKGRYVGSVKKFNEEMRKSILEQISTRKTKTEIAKSLGISRLSLYNYLEEMGIKEGLCKDLVVNIKRRKKSLGD